MSELERNKAIVRSFKECQGTKDQDATMREIMSPDYKRIRGGLVNLAENAHGQHFPEPGLFLRKALPDRVDAIEDIVAEGDRVAMLWRLQATHTGNLFGIPPTGKKIDIHEIGFFRVVDGKIVEGWFMADELGLLIQLGRQMPKREDRRIVPPHIVDEGEDTGTLARRLAAEGVLARLRERGSRDNALRFDPSASLSERSDRVVRALAEGDRVWTRFNLRGTRGSERCEMNEAGIARREGGQWVADRYLADGLGILLRLDALDVLEKLGCKPV